MEEIRIQMKGGRPFRRLLVIRVRADGDLDQGGDSGR